jgi:outer membrane biosynthesis protein TonB
MTGSRKVIYIFVSAALHVFAVAVVMYLAQPTETVYENIEVTSYVTPRLKSDASTQAKPQPEKAKATPESAAKVNNQDEVAKPQSVPGGTEHTEPAAEELASDGAITTPAALLTKIKANRTEAARKADFSGVAQIELVVGSDGRVRNALPYGLDEVALKLALASKFRPAMINNKPVASAILFKVRFESE